MVTVTETPRRFQIVMDLSEKEAVALYTVVACCGMFGVAYDIGGAFELMGLGYDTGLLEDPTGDTHELQFRERC
jgi:hypothetical protein